MSHHRRNQSNTTSSSGREHPKEHRSLDRGDNHLEDRISSLSISEDDYSMQNITQGHGKDISQEKWKTNIAYIYKMFKGMSKLFLRYYQGIHKSSLENYVKFIEHLNDKNDINKISILGYQVEQIKAFYYQHSDEFDKENLEFMCRIQFYIRTKPDGQTMIPLTDCYSEAILKDFSGVKNMDISKSDPKLVNNVNGYLYTLIYHCLDKCSPKFMEVYHRYIPDETIRTDNVSNSIDDVISKIGSKITINDPVLEDKLGKMAGVFKNALTKVAESSVKELEKEGIVDIKDENGNLILPKMAKLIPRMLLNSNIQNSMNSALVELGDANVEEMVQDVMN